MKIEYKVDKNLFEKYAKEFISNTGNKPFYFIFIILAIFTIFFLCVGIFNVQLFNSSLISYIYAIVCVVANLFLFFVFFNSKRRFVKKSVDNFYSKYKNALVTYVVEFNEDCITITNNINEDKKVILNKDVKKVVETKNIISIIFNSSVFFITKSLVGDILYLKNKFNK